MEQRSNQALYCLSHIKGGAPTALYDVAEDAYLLRIADQYLERVVTSGLAIRIFHGVEGLFLPVEELAPIAGFDEIFIAAFKAVLRCQYDRAMQ